MASLCWLSWFPKALLQRAPSFGTLQVQIRDANVTAGDLAGTAAELGAPLGCIAGGRQGMGGGAKSNQDKKQTGQGELEVNLNTLYCVSLLHHRMYKGVQFLHHVFLLTPNTSQMGVGTWHGGFDATMPSGTQHSLSECLASLLILASCHCISWEAAPDASTG